jgi:hypothetical protein
MTRCLAHAIGEVAPLQPRTSPCRCVGLGGVVSRWFYSLPTIAGWASS